MYEAYLQINGVRTKITSFGKWVEESFEEGEDVVIIIPGNPGVNGFYNSFAKTIHDKLGYSVWIIGHAGHNFPKQKISPMPPLESNEELYGLKGQVQSKAEFFEKYIPKNVKIHLIGHSIGSFMVLSLLEHQSIKDQIADVHLLFPTVEHMAESSAGKILVNFVKPIVWLLIFLSGIFTILPDLVQTLLLNSYMTIMGIPMVEHRSNIRTLIKPGILQRVFFLAFQEMELVKERDNGVIQRNLDKLKFVYGKADGWTPPHLHENLKKDFPLIDIFLTDYHHAFVLKESVPIGNLVSNWIRLKNESV